MLGPVQIGIAERHVSAALLPQMKTEKIKELQMDGEVVLMVGDGVNDSAALVNPCRFPCDLHLVRI